MQEVFEKIIEQLEEYKNENLVEHNSEQMQHCKQAGDCEMRDCTLCIFDKAIEIVKQEAEQFNNGWIPVSDRLPENNKVVLCWVVSKTIASGETSIIGSCDRGFWFLQTYEIGHHHFPVKDYEVVAWIPLPQTYHPKGE